VNIGSTAGLQKLIGGPSVEAAIAASMPWRTTRMGRPPRQVDLARFDGLAVDRLMGLPLAGARKMLGGMVVKVGGMCWVISTGNGRSPDRSRDQRHPAPAGPPVDEPDQQHFGGSRPTDGDQFTGAVPEAAAPRLS